MAVQKPKPSKPTRVRVTNKTSVFYDQKGTLVQGSRRLVLLDGRDPKKALAFEPREYEILGR